MTSIVFRTPGTLDMRAFTVMGLSAKPNSDRPIGVFGTGLKYAVAVLLRLGARFEVHTGGHRYWFETAAGEFRNGEFQQVVMRRDSWTGGEGWRVGRRQKLPFTLAYGRNWEPWMAFRELYANTLDEGGQTDEMDWVNDAHEGWRNPISPMTFIVVTHDDFTKAYRDRAATFLALGDHPTIATLPGLEVRHGETQRMYYQGLRALDIGKPALHTYNVTAPQHLTEDRQLGREWAVRQLVADTVAKCDDEALIESVIRADAAHWEHGLAPSSWTTPSDAFHRVMARRPRGVGQGWGGYYGHHDARPAARRVDPWTDSLRPWRVDGGDVLAADGQAMMSKPMTLPDAQWANLAGHVVRLANARQAPALEPGEGTSLHEQDCDFSAHLDLGACPSTHEEIIRGFRHTICDESQMRALKSDDDFGF